jgi:hypothetical protein
MAGRGRPPENLYEKWVTGNEEIVKSACRDGADLKGLAALLGCGLTTVKNLKSKFPEFAELIRIDSKKANLQVQSALFKRAVGYDYEETVSKVVVGKNGVGQQTFVEKRKRHVPPDPVAAIFWLKNREPEAWRDRREVNITDDPGEKEMTRKELIEEAKKIGMSEEEMFPDD